MTFQDYFPATVAIDPDTGTVVQSATAQVYAMTDTAFATPLAITDLVDVPIANLRASATAVYPAFKVPGHTQILVKSGDAVTPMLSVYAMIVEAGLDPSTVASAIAAAAASSAAKGAAETARTEAVAAQAAANTARTGAESAQAGAEAARLAAEGFADIAITYDEGGNVATVTDGGITTSYTYNPDGTVATDSRLDVTREYTYDEGGNLVSIEGAA